MEALLQRSLCLILAMLALSGCSLFESRATRALRASPDYQAGYGDGCSSAGGPDASHRGSDRRDDEAYKANRAYRAGFGAGLSACRPNHTRATGFSGERDPNAIPPTGP